MLKTIKSILILAVVLLQGLDGRCQETVFSLLKSDLKLADDYFENSDYHNALSLYQSMANKKPSPTLQLKIARSHLFLKQYREAVSVYEQHTKSSDLPVADLYNYAEAQSGVSNYAKAIQSYQDYLSRVPDDPLVMKKIWRLSNLQYLYEDSAHFAVRPLTVNTHYGELSPKPYRDGLVFVSNRKSIQPIQTKDAFLQTPFYAMYFSPLRRDTLNEELIHVEDPSPFPNDFNSKFHIGPFDFYADECKMVLTITSEVTGVDGRRTLQLYFAEHQAGRWKIVSSFPYNSTDYSITDPMISDDGQVLYYASDMKGGFGKKDIYKSEFINGQWSKPENVGDVINTVEDEVTPFFHHNALYFASNGHAGLGGLDIYRADRDAHSFIEPHNMGYPLNSSYDDFGIVIDSAGTHGFLSSNRKTGEYNDDIFEFDMDLQIFPVEIRGVMKWKEHNVNEGDLKLMPNAKIQLIDHLRGVSVMEHTCDQAGNFAITIPYYSKYKLKVVGEDGVEHVVSLELPKHRKAHEQHEIVIVKDVFKTN